MAYATVDELKPLIGFEGQQVTQLQMQGMQRCLDEAAAEIDWELGYDSLVPRPSPIPPQVVGVNLRRASEHWKQNYSPFGVYRPVGSDTDAIVTRLNSWQRHAEDLSPLKHQWGIA